MSDVVRKQILLNTDLVDKMKTIAKETSWSESEIIRRALTSYSLESENDEMLELLMQKLKQSNKQTEKSMREAKQAMKEAKEYFDSVKSEYGFTSPKGDVYYASDIQ